MSMTAIHLVDANTVPKSFLPTTEEPSANRPADHLGSFYVEGNNLYDVDHMLSYQ